MFAQMRAFLAPPSFSDEDQNRTSQILNSILLAIMVLLGLFLLSQLLTGAYTLQDANFYILAGLEILIAGLWVVLHRGYLRVAAYGVVFTAWSGLVFVSFNAGGVRDSGFIALIVTSMIASLVLGWRQALYFIALTIAAGWFLAYLEDQGQILLEITGPYEIAAELTTVLLLFAVMLYLLVSNLSNALEKARHSNEELRQFSEQLEERVAARTQELSLAANVAQGLSTIQDLDALLDNAVVLIQASFNLYYVQVYLLDESGEYLVLHAGTGGVGQTLLEQKHRLPLASQSINSTAVTNKQPVIVADTSKSTLFQPNPLLPQTRSEMAVPLILENQAVGVLNLQSNKVGEVSNESLPAFQTLAGQLAIAINNANLFTERKQAVASLQEEQRHVQTILESISVPMVISLVQDGRAAYVNDAMAEIIQMPREELLNKATPDFYADPIARQKFLANLQQTGQVSNYELQLKRGDGSLFWALISARAISFQNQPAILTTLIDITDRYKAETSLTKRAAELEAVAQVGSIATNTLDSQTLLQNVVDLTKDRFNLYHAHIYLLDETQHNLVLAAGAGAAGRQMVAQGLAIPLEKPQSLVARAARTRQGVIVNNVQQDAGFLPNPLLPDTHAEMAVPIVIGERVLGVLDIQSDQANYFTAEDINIHATLAAQVAVALQNASQYQSTQAALAETEGLLNVTRVASSSLELRDTLFQVLDQVLAMKQFDAGLVSLVNPVTNSLELTAHRLPDDLYQSFLEAGLDGTLCDLVYRNRQSLVLANLEKDTPIDVSALIAKGYQSYQGFPIEFRGEILGTICIFNSKPGIKKSDSGLMQAIGQQVGVAVQNAVLFEQTQAALAQTEAFRNLVESSSQAVAIAALDGAMSYANPAMLRLLEFEELSLLLGESITNYYPEEFRITAELEMIPTVMEVGQWQGEMKIITPSGREVPTLESYTLLRDENGEPNGLAVIIIDITERKQAEEAQQRLASALEERLQEVNALQRAMTHEGWQAFFAAKERPIQGYRFYNEGLRLISRRDLNNEDIPDLPISVSQANKIASSDQEITTAAPMQVRGETIGMLGARSSDGKPIDPETRELLMAISAQVAEALERARLFEETELSRQALDQRAKELQAVAEISTTASTSLDKQAFMNMVTSLTQQRFDIYHCNIFTFDERSELFELAATSWRPDDSGTKFEATKVSLHQEQSLIARAARQREPVVINDTRQDPHFLPSAMMPRTRSELAIPLLAGNRVLGVLDILADQVAHFTEEDVRIFATLGAQMAISLQNAELFANAQRRAEREALINTISQKIQNAPTVQSAMQTAVAELGKALRAKRTFVDLQLSREDNGRSD